MFRTRFSLRSIVVSTTAALTITFSSSTLFAQSSPAVSTLEAATHLGLSPKSVTASGLHNSAATILQRIEYRLDLREEIKTLRDLEQIRVNAVSQLAAACQSAAADQTAHNDYAIAVQELAAVQAQLTAKCAELRDYALDGASTQSEQMLLAWRNSSQSVVAPEMRVIAPSGDIRWIDVAHALRAEKRAVRRGEELDEDVALILTQIRTHPEVVAAKLRLLTELTAVETTFASYVETPSE